MSGLCAMHRCSLSRLLPVALIQRYLHGDSHGDYRDECQKTGSPAMAPAPGTLGC
jgi:hypothetical protein